MPSTRHVQSGETSSPRKIEGAFGEIQGGKLNVAARYKKEFFVGTQANFATASISSQATIAAEVVFLSERAVRIDGQNVNFCLAIVIQVVRSLER